MTVVLVEESTRTNEELLVDNVEVVVAELSCSTGLAIVLLLFLGMCRKKVVVESDFVSDP